MRLYRRACLGGTFDIIHLGHERLLEVAFAFADEVYIGVTSDAFVTRLGKQHPVRPFAERVRALERFLEARGLLHRARIFRLDDPFGPAAHDPSLEAIVVSEETMARAFEANSLRKSRGLPPLAIVVVKMVLAEDGRPISTTRIYRGEIDREGRLIRERAAR